VWDELPPHIFTLATVDNFDVLQSHAAVYCGDQQRSYHGTTMQVVQPNPSIHIPNVVQIGLLPPSPMQVDISAKSPNRETAFNYTSTPLAVKAPL